MAKTKYRIGGEVAGALAFLRGDDLNIFTMRGRRNDGNCEIWNQITADGVTNDDWLMAIAEYEKGWVRGWWGGHADANGTIVAE